MEFVNKNKLNNISLSKYNFSVLSDFDRTLTAGGSKNIWRVIYSSNLLRDSFRKAYDEIHDKFPNEGESVEIKQQNYINRFREYFKLLETHNLSEQIIKESVKQTDIKLRNGASGFLNKMYENNIPVVIISCGLKNIIIEYLKHNNIYFDNIYVHANYMDLNGVEKNNIYDVTPYNKDSVKLPLEIANKVKDKKYKLLFGDILNDIKMVQLEELEATITTGFLDKDIESNLDKYKEQFDIVLTDRASFDQIEEILSFNF